MKQREHWSSRTGFIMAAAGSAVGLGNMWKFPYITYDNGGGSFVLIYLVCIALVGLPIMVAEIVIGRRSQRGLLGAFAQLRQREPAWRVVGWAAIATGFIILSYYSVVAGWTLEYAYRSTAGAFAGMDAAAISQHFGEFLADPTRQVAWHAVFMGLTLAVVSGGIAGGIERWAKILMPVLIVLILFLVVYALSVGNPGRAISFLFSFSPITAHGVLEALGHSFFTLSLGMGVMVAYGSYLGRDHDIGSVAVTVTLMDTAIALLACLMLYPIVFSYDLPIAESIGIIFTTLPFVFQGMPLGNLVAPIFFALMAFAALTSAISLLEVVVTYAVDELDLSRRKAAALSALAIFLFGVPSAWCNGAIGWLSELTLLSKGDQQLNWLDSFDYLASNWLLPLGGLAIALFVGWRMTRDDLEEELMAAAHGRRMFDFWRFALRWPTPLLVLIVLLYKIGLIG